MPIRDRDNEVRFLEKPHATLYCVEVESSVPAALGTSTTMAKAKTLYR